MLYMFLIPFKSSISFLAQHRTSGQTPKKSGGIELKKEVFQKELQKKYWLCLLYTSDAADDIGQV